MAGTHRSACHLYRSGALVVVISRSQGLKAWLFQRLSAIYIGIFAVIFMLRFAFEPPQSFDAWRGWITSPVMTIATALFFWALLVHAWVGLRDVIIDYINAFAVRFLFLVLLGLTLAGLGLWVARILLLGVA